MLHLWSKAVISQDVLVLLKTDLQNNHYIPYVRSPKHMWHFPCSSPVLCSNIGKNRTGGKVHGNINGQMGSPCRLLNLPLYANSLSSIEETESGDCTVQFVQTTMKKAMAIKHEPFPWMLCIYGSRFWNIGSGGELNLWISSREWEGRHSFK